jgi:Uma2 family endonuclease
MIRPPTATLRGALLRPSLRRAYAVSMPLAPEYFTADMVRALPEDGQRHEVVLGELLLTPAPGWQHQRIVGRLFRLLAAACDEIGTLEAMIAPADVSWGEDTLVQPDIFVVPKELAIAGEPARAPALALVAEVLSPSTARQDRLPKRALYQRQGVATIWLVDPEQRLVEVWTPDSSRPRVERDELTWHIDVSAAVLTIDLQLLFEA